MVNAPGSVPLTLDQRQLLRSRYWSQFKGGYLARISHELRSPLSTIMGLQQLILNDLCDSPEEERDCVDQAHRAAQKLLEMLNQVVLVSKLEQGPPNLQLQSLDLGDVLGEVQLRLMALAADRNTRLEMDIPLEPYPVWSDPKGLPQVLTILIDSAIALKSSFIRVSVQVSPSSGNATAPETCEIWLEDDRSADGWQESLTLLADEQAAQTAIAAQTTPDSASKIPSVEGDRSLSPGLALWIAQDLMVSMGGQLRLAARSVEEPLTRWVVTIPLNP